jgi:acyl-CoA reductase-like NAD-dependent aldehyde dehydrogenase
VTLSMWIVRRFTGTPHALDGQRLKWVTPAGLSEADILEADRPFIEALQGRLTMHRYTGEHFDVRNPRTGQVDHRFDAPDPSQLKAIAASLRAAQPGWAAAGLEHRIAVMQQWKAALVEAQAEIASALSRDTGRYAISLSETLGQPAAIDRWCRTVRELPPEAQGRSVMMPSVEYRVQRVPYPLVGVISPWNFPLSLALIDAIPALLAGCAVLVKPSEVTPRFVEPLRRTVERVPELARVLVLQPGGREMGEAMIGLSDVVCFTGSVKTGRSVAENAARHFIPAFLELGGKDPVIVTGSADIEKATDIVLRASVLATGQACQSLERVYVDRRIHDAFVQRLAEKAAATPINWPNLHEGITGPFIFGRQADIVAEQIADAVAKGAKVLAGGTVQDHGGKWLPATVLANVNHSMTIMTEETFGPVMPVMPYDTIEEAIALANDGVYGLSAAVIAGSLDEAEAIGRRIEAGAVSLNDGSLTSMVHDAEKNSFKLSGMGGSRMGPAGYTRFYRSKVLFRQTGDAMKLEAVREDNVPATLRPK